MVLTSALQAHAERVVLIADSGSLTGADLCSAAERTLRQVASLLKATTPAKYLVSSPQAEDVITAALIGERLGGSLYIAHSYLAPEHLEAVIREQKVELVLETGLEPRRVEGAEIAIAPRECTICLMTSGTTGLPKIARHTVEALIGRIRNPGAQGGGYCWLLTYPPSSFAGIQVLLTAMLTGGTLICPPDYSIRTLACWAETHGATHISGTPTFWRSIVMGLGAGHGLPELRQITIGGETIDQATLDRLRERFPGARITHIYATTEAGSVFAVSDGRAGFPADWLRQPVDGVEHTGSARPGVSRGLL